MKKKSFNAYDYEIIVELKEANGIGLSLDFTCSGYKPTKTISYSIDADAIRKFENDNFLQHECNKLAAQIMKSK